MDTTHWILITVPSGTLCLCLFGILVIVTCYFTKKNLEEKEKLKDNLNNEGIIKCECGSTRMKRIQCTECGQPTIECIECQQRVWPCCCDEYESEMKQRGKYNEYVGSEQSERGNPCGGSRSPASKTGTYNSIDEFFGRRRYHSALEAMGVTEEEINDERKHSQFRSALDDYLDESCARGGPM